MTLLEKYNQLSPPAQARARRSFMSEFATCKKTFYNKINGGKIRPSELKFLERELNQV